MSGNIFAIVYSLAALSYLYIVLQGFGFYLYSILNSKINAINDFLILPWYGYFLLTSLIFIINLILPINWLVSVLIIVISIPGFILSCYSQIRVNKSFFLYLFAVMAMTGGITTLVTVGACNGFDLGLYHLQAIRIINSYSIIPGLSSLHHRLGNISSMYNISALISFFPFGLRAPLFNIPTALLLSLFILHQSISGYIHIKERFIFLSVYNTLSIIIVLGFWNSFLYPLDIAVLLYELLIAYYMLKLFLTREKGDFEKLTILAVSGVTIKMSLAPFALTAFCLMLCLSVNREKSIKLYTRLGCLCLLLISPFFIHHIIKTGMLLFPMERTDLNLLWGNTGAAIENRTAVTGWARQPGPEYRESLHTWDWLPTWWERNQKSIILPTIFLLVSFGIYISALFYCKKGLQEWLNAILLVIGLLIPVTLGLLYWFLVTADYRFSGALFWLPSLFFASLTVKETNHRTVKVKVSLLLTIIFSSLLYRNHIYYKNQFLNIHFPEIPVNKLERKTTQSGLNIYRPIGRGQAWDTEFFPNTPYFNSNLSLIGKDIENGFTIKN